jgi:hypothetical protein
MQVVMVYPYFSSPIPRSVEQPIETVASSDGRWLARSYYVSFGGAMGGTEGVVELVSTESGERRQIYYGEPVMLEWLDGDLVATEEGSGVQHVLNPTGRPYDWRFDDRERLAWAIAFAVALTCGAVWGGVTFLLFGWRGVRRL